MADTDRDHPLQRTRPNVPEHEQPRSKQSHPAAIAEEDGHVQAHEQSDVNVRAIAIFVIGLFVVAAIIHVGLWGLMELFARQAAEADPRVAPLSAPAGTLPPEPRLLTNEPAALRELRDEEDALLKNIDAAKQAIVDEGLPARSDGREPAVSPAEAAAQRDTSSGRIR
jgi:hypothetical protein